MSDLPEWLPETISVDGNFQQVLGRLYNIFHRDFVASQPRLENMDVWYNRNVKTGRTYEEAFWHLIQRDYKKDGNRTFDPQRAEKLPWCRPVIEHCTDSSITYWLCNDRGKFTYYVWLEDFDYVVILEKRKLKAKTIDGVHKPQRVIVFLKTAYHVDGASKRRYFRRKYKDRIE